MPPFREVQLLPPLLLPKSNQILPTVATDVLTVVTHKLSRSAQIKLTALRARQRAEGIDERKKFLDRKAQRAGGKAWHEYAISIDLTVFNLVGVPLRILIAFCHLLPA